MSDKLAFADISPKQAKKLLGAEIGTQFDIRLNVIGCFRTGVTVLFLIIPHGPRWT